VDVAVVPIQLYRIRRRILFRHH